MFLKNVREWGGFNIVLVFRFAKNKGTCIFLLISKCKIYSVYYFNLILFCHSLLFILQIFEHILQICWTIRISKPFQDMVMYEYDKDDNLFTYWLIDWIVFYAVSATFQPYDEGSMFK